MKTRIYPVTEVALTQLQTALHLYLERRDENDEKEMLSVITLAGAAEEILGKLLAAEGREPTIESIKKAFVAIHRKLSGDEYNITPKEAADFANRAKNRLKHWNVDTDSRIISLDPDQEACDMLNRAIDNYWMLEEKLTPAMERFLRETSHRDLFDQHLTK